MTQATTPSTDEPATAELNVDTLPDDVTTVGFGVYHDATRSFLKRLDRHDTNVFPTVEAAAEHAATMVERHGFRRRDLEIVPVASGLSFADSSFDTLCD